MRATDASHSNHNSSQHFTQADTTAAQYCEIHHHRSASAANSPLQSTEVLEIAAQIATFAPMLAGKIIASFHAQQPGLEALDSYIDNGGSIRVICEACQQLVDDDSSADCEDEHTHPNHQRIHAEEECALVGYLFEEFFRSQHAELGNIEQAYVEWLFTLLRGLVINTPTAAAVHLILKTLDGVVSQLSDTSNTYLLWIKQLHLLLDLAIANNVKLTPADRIKIYDWALHHAEAGAAQSYSAPSEEDRGNSYLDPQLWGLFGDGSTDQTGIIPPQDTLARLLGEELFPKFQEHILGTSVFTGFPALHQGYEAVCDVLANDPEYWKRSGFLGHWQAILTAMRWCGAGDYQQAVTVLAREFSDPLQQADIKNIFAQPINPMWARLMFTGLHWKLAQPATAINHMLEQYADNASAEGLLQLRNVFMALGVWDLHRAACEAQLQAVSRKQYLVYLSHTQQWAALWDVLLESAPSLSTQELEHWLGNAYPGQASSVAVAVVERWIRSRCGEGKRPRYGGIIAVLAQLNVVLMQEGQPAQQLVGDLAQRLVKDLANKPGLLELLRKEGFVR